jgi:hypothetical protein
MPKFVAILDDLPETQRLGVAMLRAVGSIVDSVQFVIANDLPTVADRHTLYCPLTLNIPPNFQFWGQSIWQTCGDLDRLRHLCATTVGVKVGDGGNLWLPVIWTVKDPIYSDPIELSADGNYRSIEIDDRDLQSLQQFSNKLLTKINAPAAVYLIQAKLAETGIVFDRLFPFPATPALASLGKKPDLFEHHWRCIS